jgi:hypothetical protein
MNFLPLFAPDTPGWFLSLVTCIAVGGSIGMLIWGFVLEIRLPHAYPHGAVSSKERWRKAIILALLQTSIIPLLGLVGPVLSPHPNQFPVFPLFCGGIWIVILPIAILYKKWVVDLKL